MRLSIIFLMLILVMTTSCSKTEIIEEQFTATALVSSNSDIELEIFVLVNNYRIELGLSTLSYDTRAQSYAADHNAYMISKNEISHDNFAKRSSELSVDFDAVKISENVGRNFTTAQEVFEAWLASEGHLKNIEGDYDATAISVYTDANGMLYFMQIFIK